MTQSSVSPVEQSPPCVASSLSKNDSTAPDTPEAMETEAMEAKDENSVRHLEERILAMTPTGRDGFLLKTVLGHSDISCELCSSMEDLCHHANAGTGALLLAEESITPEGIDCLHQWLTHQEPWSDIPLLILTSGGYSSRTGGDTLTLLEKHCNITLLERPLRRETLISAIQAALRARQRQYQMRDLLHQLKTGVRQRDEFLAMLGHELRNPLFTIRTAVELLNQSGSQGSEEVQSRRIIERQAQHLSHLIDDLLDVTRITQGKIPLQLQPLDLNEIARRCLQSIELTDKAHQHEISSDLPAQPILIEGDMVRLEQILNNLLTNAVKYTPAGGKVHLLVAAEANTAIVRVSDTGLGIDPDLQPYVFDLFTQSTRSLDRAQGGLGIGLTVTRGLVEMHGGRIKVFSEGLGKGSTFEVRLPLLSIAERPAVRVATPIGDLSCRVLIIEDNADARLLMTILLQKRGCRVEIAEDGLMGVETALRHDFDIALVDIGLPGIDGYEVARRLRAQLNHSPFLIALTGYGQVEDQQRALEAGFNLHLTKPVEPDDLLRVISEAMNPET